MNYMKRLLAFVLMTLLFLLFPLSQVSSAQAATLRLSSSSFTLEVGHYKTLSVSGTRNKVTWSSSNKSVAAVSSTGKVTAKAPGTATIYANVSGKKLSGKVTVIKLNYSSATLATGDTKTLKVSGSSAKVTWSSSNKSIAAVSSAGKVTAKAPGTVTIYASVSGKKLSSKITVVKLNYSSATLTTGDTKTLKVSGSSAQVTWTSSNKSVATVSSAGKVTAKAAGTATISATVSGKALKSTITVKAKNPVTPTPTVTPSTTPTATPVPTMTPEQSAAATPSTTPDTNSDSSAEPIAATGTKIIGYYASWSAYSGYTPDRIDAAKLTHINYAFANIGSDLKVTLGYPDIDPGNISKLNQLKKVNPALKTLISVGGWSWSGRFSDVAATEANRITFADSLVDFIVKYGFDGVDIDWEYPVSGGLSTNSNRPEDKYNFTLLMKTIRERLDARGKIDGKSYLLSFAGGAGSGYIRNTELNKLSQYVDYATVMTYDIHGSWEPYTNFNAPLYVNDPVQPYQISVDSSIQSWLQACFPKNKLVMGVPFYGYVYNAAGSNNQGLYQTYSGASSISYGTLAAYYLNNPDYKQYFHSGSKVPWLYNGSTFITYENEQSMAEKAKYIEEKGLQGAMIWELSQDPNRVLLSSLYKELN